MTDNLIRTSQYAQNDNLPDYRAFTVGKKKQSKITLFNAQGFVVGMPSYTHYANAASPSSLFFWLVFTSGVYLFEGQNLPGDLLLYLKEDRISEIQVYHPRYFLEPGPDEPVIMSITLRTHEHFIQSLGGAMTGGGA